MEGKKLEKIMLEFINNEFDILLSTTIIESGLDVPNANTIFINNAQNFGLSECLFPWKHPKQHHEKLASSNVPSQS